MRLVIDCDPGNGIPGADVDDGLAIAYALALAPEAVVGVSIVAGNSRVDEGVRSALYLLSLAGRADIAVWRGSPEPLCGDVHALRSRLDSRVPSADRGNWPSLPAPTSGPSSQEAADALIELARRYGQDLLVVALGPLTNIAEACRRDPGFATSVREMVIMGGNIGLPGIRWDLNFGYDPEAAAAVLASGGRIRLLPLDVTMRTAWTLDQAASLAGSANPFTHWLAVSAVPWIRYVCRTRGLAGCWLHDPLAVALALHPEWADYATMRVGVDTSDGPQRGATMVAHSGRPGILRPQFQGADVSVVVDAQLDTFQHSFDHALRHLSLGAVSGGIT